MRPATWHLTPYTLHLAPYTLHLAPYTAIHTAFPFFLALKVGFKLCVGRPMELVQIVQAMLKHDFVPDFITVDGAEGGTGAAPPEFSNSVGMPLQEALYVEK